MTAPVAPKVLVVGAGCTGALVSALLRQMAAHRPMHLSVWEWARGPAGRMTSFWANFGEDLSQKCLADVGAQVISVRSSERVPPWLKPHIMPANHRGLARTDERVEHWNHFFAPEGLPSLQRRSLEEAQPDELCFNRRVVELVLLSDRGVPKRWRASYAGEQGGRRPVGFEDFDLVVFAGTSADALNLKGLQVELTNRQLHLLRNARYDHRLCVALVLKPELATAFEELCEGKAEHSFGDDGVGPISLLARQDVKGRVCSSACSIVLHSTVGFAANNLQVAKRQNCSPSDIGKHQLLLALAHFLGMSIHSLQGAVLHDKVVHWRQCQVQRLPKMQSDQASCLVIGATSQLILAGDFLAQPDLAGSFEGCLESAEAAAREACRVLFPVVAAPGLGSEALGSAAAPAVAGRWRGPPSHPSADTSSVKNGDQQVDALQRRARRWQAKALSGE